MIAPTGTAHSGSRVRGLALPLAALVVVGFVLYLLFGGPRLTDQEQMYAILEDIRTGVGQQDVGKTMEHASPQFDASGLTRQQARLEVAQFFHQHATSSIVFRQPAIQIKDNDALIDVYVELMASPMSGGGPAATVYHGNVQLTLEREDTRRFGIVPSHEWRIVKAQVPNLESVEGL